MQLQPIKYDTSVQADFQKELKKNIDEYFSSTNQGTKGNWLMAFKVVFFITWMIGGYYVLFTATTFWQTFAGYMLSGTGSLLTTITVAHDASHKALSKNKYINKVFSYAWSLLGLSTYFWEAKHHHSHHSFTNVVEYDQDISQIKVIRMNPAAQYKKFHRYQKFYAPLLYAFFGFFAITFREFKLYGVRQYGNTYSKHGPTLLFNIILMKIFYFGLNLALPLYLIPIPAWQIILSFLLMVSIAGMYIALVLVVPHLNMHALFKVPSESGMINTNWFTHSLEVTVDSSPSSRLVNWFTGGLNTHVIHHFFPHICHIHYAQLTPIVKSTAEKFGLEYKQQSFVSLLGSHFRFLGELGKNENESLFRLHVQN